MEILNLEIKENLQVESGISRYLTNVSISLETCRFKIRFT